MAWWDVCNQGTQCLPWNPVGGDWGVNGARSDYGVPLAQGTQITAPVNGVVLPQHPGGGFYSVFGRQSFGGEVDILTFMPEYGGLANVGVIHMDTASVQPGRVVHKGEVIGTSGGQTSGGHWPSSPQFSSGPHVGIQVHRLSSWNALLNPAALMQNLWAGKDSSSVPTPQQLQQAGQASLNTALTQASSGNGSQCDWSTWVQCLLGNQQACFLCSVQGGVNVAQTGATATGFLSAFPGLVRWLSDPLRFLKIAAGGILVVLGLVLAFLPDVLAGASAAAGVPEASSALAGAGRGNLRHRVRQGIVAAGAVQQQRTLRATAARAEARAQRMERAQQAQQRQRSIQSARATIGAPGTRPPPMGVAPRRVRTLQGGSMRVPPGMSVGAVHSQHVSFRPSGQGVQAPTPPPTLPPGLTPGTPEYEARQEQFRQMRRTLDE